jgi:hypothetical protein
MSNGGETSYILTKIPITAYTVYLANLSELYTGHKKWCFEMQFNKITKKILQGATTPTFSFPVGTDHLYVKEQSKVLWSEVRHGASHHMLIPLRPIF